VTTVIERPVTTAGATTAEAAAPAAEPLVRVERGSLADEELAALTAVLLTRAGTLGSSGSDGGFDAAASGTPVVPLWDRPERHAPYRSPVSWRR